MYSSHLNHYITSATLHQESYCWEVRLAILQYSFKALVDLLVSPLLIPLVLTQYRWWPISAPLRQSSDLNLKELYMIVQVYFVFSFSLLLLAYWDNDANSEYTNLASLLPALSIHIFLAFHLLPPWYFTIPLSCTITITTLCLDECPPCNGCVLYSTMPLYHLHHQLS